jgi:hypothetical protein
VEPLGSHWPDYHDIGYFSIFRKSVEKIQVSFKSDKNNHYTFLIISRSVLLRMRNVSDKSCRENQNTHFMLNNVFRKSTVYEIKWKNIVERGWLWMTAWRMRIACWIPNATNTHTQVV